MQITYKSRDTSTINNYNAQVSNQNTSHESLLNQTLGCQVFANTEVGYELNNIKL